jgi:hypothetical protein
MLLTFFLGFGCFAFIYWLNSTINILVESALEMEVNDEPGAQRTYFIVKTLQRFSSIIVVVFNKFALGFIIHKIVDMEYWSTMTRFNISFAQKYSTVGVYF